MMGYIISSTYVGIQVYGPGPSRFYPPTSSQPVSTENGSTTKLLTLCLKPAASVSM